jgi:hypothetical protein
VAYPDENVRSQLLPGGDLVSAVLNRQVMGLADRGGSSGIVGRRWADLCMDWMSGQVGQTAVVPVSSIAPYIIERIARLDDLPNIATAASKLGLQNPDIVLIGQHDGRSIVQAADAKFSVETARSKQVSPDVIRALLALDGLVQPLTGRLTNEIEFVPGVFLSPDFALTHLMLRGHRGITRATVKPNEVVFIPVDAGEFFEPLPTAAVLPVLSAVDRLPVSISENLLAGLYYFRLARAAAGCWLDSVKPLLLFNDAVDVDEIALVVEARKRSIAAHSAFDLVLTWDVDVESIRAQRAAVDQVTGLPVVTRELRDAILSVAGSDAERAPSVNQVRRRLGAWYRGEIRAIAGPVPPGDSDFPNRLRELGKISAAIAKRLPQQTIVVIEELMAARPAETPDEKSINGSSC